MFVVEGVEVEELLKELPGADYVADPDGDGGFADVPELVGCGHGGSEVVVPYPSKHSLFRRKEQNSKRSGVGESTYLFNTAHMTVARPMEKGMMIRTLRLGFNCVFLTIARGT